MIARLGLQQSTAGNPALPSLKMRFRSVPANTIASTRSRRIGAREIFVHYPNGMGRSKLRIPAARMGTARNMNTVAKLTGIASKP
jgi:uncharacterized protein (DUF1697 family)